MIAYSTRNIFGTKQKRCKIHDKLYLELVILVKASDS